MITFLQILCERVVVQHHPWNLASLTRHIESELPIRVNLPRPMPVATPEQLTAVVKALKVHDLLHNSASKSHLAKEFIDMLDALGIHYDIFGGLGQSDNTPFSTNAELAHKHGLFSAQESSHHLGIPQKQIEQTYKPIQYHHINGVLTPFYKQQAR